MVKSRAELLCVNPIFTEHLLRIQDAKHNPQNNLNSEGDKVILDSSNKSVTLTKEKAEELNKEDKQYYESKKDKNPFESKLNLEYFGTATLITPKKKIKEYLNDLGEAIEGLRVNLNQKELIILGDWPTPWLSQKNNYEPVKISYQFLTTKVDKHFNGGFALKETELIEFIPILFWLVRCNASLPVFLMSFTNASTIISLCKNGVLHLEFYNNEEQLRVLDFFTKKGFLEVETCRDPIVFDDFNGREFKLEK